MSWPGFAFVPFRRRHFVHGRALFGFCEAMMLQSLCGSFESVVAVWMKDVVGKYFLLADVRDFQIWNHMSVKGRDAAPAHAGSPEGPEN